MTDHIVQFIYQEQPIKFYDMSEELSTSMAKDIVFPRHHILDHYVTSHVVGGMQGTYVRTVQMLRSR